MDPTKINLSVTDPLLDGEVLSRRLREEYGIQVELFSHRMVMCLTGLGTRWSDLSKLLQALHRITETHREEQQISRTQEAPFAGEAGEADAEAWIRPHEVRALPEEKEWIALAEAAGCTAAASVTPYPPGVPALCPGEVYTEEDIAHITRLLEEGGAVMGVAENGKVLVGKERAK
jgi:arginine decarboxylase